MELVDLPDISVIDFKIVVVSKVAMGIIFCFIQKYVSRLNLVPYYISFILYSSFIESQSVNVPVMK